MDNLCANHRDKVGQFMAFTGDSEKNAIQTLRASYWHLESAFDVFYSQPRSEADMRRYLELVNNNSMVTNFRMLLETKKLNRLKALAQTSPHATAPIADTMFSSIFQLLMEIMPKQKSEKDMNYSYIECLQYTIHHLDQNKTADDTPLFHTEDFKKRLKYVRHITLAKMEKLAQTFSKQDKHFPNKHDPYLIINKSSWERERKESKTEVRTCNNILAMTKVLQGKAPSFVQEDSVTLSWKDSKSPPASKIHRKQHSAQKIPPNRDQINSLSKDCLDFLQTHGYCYINEDDAKKLAGLSRFQQLDSNNLFLLNDRCQIGMLSWQLDESEFSSCFVKGRDSNKGISGMVRNQMYHLLCWAYASSDLVSAVRCMQKWDNKYYPLCTWYLSSFCCPEKLGTDEEAKVPDNDGCEHHCYGNSIESALYHIQENGIPREFVDTFLCTDHTPPTADEPEKQSRRIIEIRRINSMKDAILELQKNPKQPIGADLIAYRSLFRNQLGKPQIYYGPRAHFDSFIGYHAVVIEDFQLIDGQLVAVCKMSNGERVADAGYAYVSVTTQYIPVGVCESKKASVLGSDEPMHLLTNFITIDMDVKEETEENDEEEEDMETDEEEEEEEEEEEDIQEDNKEDKAKEDQEPGEEEEEDEEYIHEAKRRRVGLGFRSHFTHRQLLRVLGHGDAEKLASLADLYVNYAFRTAHRGHASIEGVTKFLKPSVAGFLLQKVVPASGIEDIWMGLNNGPDSIKTFKEALNTTQTVIWNGPMGVFEMEKFAAGTEGRPKGFTPKFSLAPLVPRLSELLSIEVQKTDCIGPEVESLVASLPEGGVLLLENVRFYKEEEKNDPEFAKKLVWIADLYVNDAFGTSHIAHASTEGVTKFLKVSVAGFLLQKELDYLVGAVSNPKRPFAAIVGGSKVSSKIGVFESLLEKSDILFLIGGMIFTFYKAQGLPVGSPLVEEDKLELATSLLAKAKAKGVSLLLPTDVVVADKFAPDANNKVVPASRIEDIWMGLNNGPDSIKTFKEALDTTQTVIWNGPMGFFEMEKFVAGTEAIANKVAELSEKGVTTIIGGGDSVAAVEKVGVLVPYLHGEFLVYSLHLQELDYLVGAVSNPKRPFAAIVGGSKASSKIGVIKSLLEKCDILLLGGGMIFAFYKAQGFSVGSSLVEEDKLELAISLLAKSKAKGVSLLLPTDVVVADKFTQDANNKVVPASGIEDGWMGLDIGPDSIKTFNEALDTTQTVIWNGPMGVFEMEKFAAGTEAVANKLAELSEKGVTTIIGGGDSVAAVEKVGVAGVMSHISTGVGAVRRQSTSWCDRP